MVDGITTKQARIDQDLETKDDGIERSNHTLEIKVQNMLTSIFTVRPKLREVMSEGDLKSYFSKPLEWAPSEVIFKGKAILINILLKEIIRLYGIEVAEAMKSDLRKCWTVESGVHLSLPRRYDKPGHKEGPQLNPVLFQGQVLWAALRKDKGYTYSLSLSSGRVPINNINSAAYLDLPSQVNPMRLVSDKFRETPETLIPPLDTASLRKKREQIMTLKGQRGIPIEEFNIAMKVFDNLERQGESSFPSFSKFSDQIATTHALLINKALNNSVQQITLDSEVIALHFFIELLEDKTSVIYKIFSSPDITEKFIDFFKDIDTGWGEGQGPLYSIEEKHGTMRTKEYSGSYMPAVLLEGLRNRKILPKGVLKFFIFMVDAGLCTLGGMNQSTYTAEIRDRAVDFMKQIKEEDKSTTLVHLPCDKTLISPCWGINTKDDVSLLDGVTALVKPLSNSEVIQIAQMRSIDAIVLASPSLYPFLVEKPSLVTYRELLYYPGIMYISKN